MMRPLPLIMWPFTSKVGDRLANPDHSMLVGLCVSSLRTRCRKRTDDILLW